MEILFLASAFFSEVVGTMVFIALILMGSKFIFDGIGITMEP